MVVVRMEKPGLARGKPNHSASISSNTVLFMRFSLQLRLHTSFVLPKLKVPSTALVYILSYVDQYRTHMQPPTQSVYNNGAKQLRVTFMKVLRLRVNNLRRVNVGYEVNTYYRG